MKPFFNDRTRTVCFLGDSITRRGYWVAEVFEHLRTRGIRVYNCGVSGDSSSGALLRLYTDCLSRTPDTVVMMFGMNDVGRTLYECAGEPDAENLAKRAARLEKFAVSMRSLCEKIRAAGVDLILCTPTPYNDVTPTTLPRGPVNDGLSACAEIVRALAEEFSLPCVDFFTELRPKVGGEYATLPDLVHPTPESHHPMAQYFLREAGEIGEVDPTPFLPMGEAAQARFDVEQKAREIEFIEWNLMFGERKKRPMTHTDCVALARERLAAAEAAGDARQIQWYANYLKIVDRREEFERELVQRTMEMAAAAGKPPRADLAVSLR